LGAITAHWITGWMRDTIGTYQFAFAIAAMMSFLAMILIRFVRKAFR
jgi:hypothetical protein